LKHAWSDGLAVWIVTQVTQALFLLLQCMMCKYLTLAVKLTVTRLRHFGMVARMLLTAVDEMTDQDIMVNAVECRTQV